MSWRHSSMKCQTNSGHKHKMWARKGLAETLQSNSSKRKGGPRRVTSKTNGLQTKLKLIWGGKKKNLKIHLNETLLSSDSQSKIYNLGHFITGLRNNMGGRTVLEGILLTRYLASTAVLHINGNLKQILIDTPDK